MKTNDHFSSNWTSRVFGGKRHDLVVELAGVLAGEPGVADHGVAVHLHQPGGGADAVAFGEVLEDRGGLLLGQLRAEEGRPLAFGEPSLAAAAVEQPPELVLAVEGADGQVIAASLAVVGALGVQAAEARQVLGHGVALLIRPQGVRSGR